jgi:cysteinyl-tRNA synthetase
LAAIFRVVKQLNRLLSSRRIAVDQVPKVLDGFHSIDAVLQIFDFDATRQDPAIMELQSRREAARKAHDWDLADLLRKELMALGVTVRDGKIE